MPQHDDIVPIVRYQIERHLSAGSGLEFYAYSAKWEDIRAAWFERSGQLARAAAHSQAAEAYYHLARGPHDAHS